MLNFACGWAKGQTGDVSVADKLTNGLYFSNYFIYNLADPNIPTVYFTQSTQVFKLKYVIDDWLDPGPSGANCVDVSFSIELLCKSLGINASCKRIREIDNYAFLTNPMCPIGSDPTQSYNYKQARFGFHQQTYVQTNVFDGALALQYDLSGATYQKPPVNWDVFDYWQKFNVQGFPVLGLVYRKWLTTDTPLSGWGYSPDPNYGPTAVNNMGTVSTIAELK